MEIEELRKALPLAEEYRKVKIPKKGGYRTLLIPSPELKKAQRKILAWLRKNFYQPNLLIYGLCSGSYVEHAKWHADSRFVFTFDIKDAFPSVKASRIRESLLKEIISLKASKNPQTTLEDLEEAKKLTDLIISLTTFQGTLPQGAPTSPFLFYLYLLKSGLLRELIWLRPPKWKISCYVDGFVISGPKPLSSERKQRILRCLEKFGFKVNSKKIHEFDCRQGAPLICGIRVHGNGRISLPKKKIRKWRGIIHRACFDPNPEIIRKIEGFIASLKPIYGKNLPPQIEKTYLLLKNKINPLS